MLKVHSLNLSFSVDLFVFRIAMTESEDEMLNDEVLHGRTDVSLGILPRLCNYQREFSLVTIQILA